jgi:iron(III) transport system permease protein
LQLAKQHFYWWNYWMVGAIIILFAIATPLLTIFFKIFEPKGESWSHLADNLLLSYFSNTLLILIGVAFTTFLLGVSTAWIVTNYAFPGRRYFEWLLILPLGVPGYIMAYTYVGLLDYAGPLQTLMRNSFGIQVKGSLMDIMNIPGAIFILSITLFPYVYLLARASFIQQSKTLQEASLLLGRGNWPTFYKVALPMARPAIVGGLALASMEVLNDYGTVKYFGIQTFTTGIFRAWFSMGDVATAIYLAAILILIVFGILYLENMQRGKRRFSQVTGSGKPLIRVTLKGPAKASVTLYCVLLVLVSFIVPIAQLLQWAALTYTQVIDIAFFLLIARSFSLAAVTGVLIAGFSVVLVYSIRLSPFPWLKNITKICTLGYAIPGAVIAVGIMIPMLGIDHWLMATFNGANIGLLLSGTLLALIFAYLVRFMAVGYNPIDAGFQKIGIHVNEASRLLGRGTCKTLWKVDLPMIKTSLFSGFLLVFVDVLKELPLTLILRPFNYHTLATKAFDMATNEMIAESANASLIIILTGIIPIIFLNRLIRKKVF